MENPQFENVPQLLSEINETLKRIEKILHDKNVTQSLDFNRKMHFKEAAAYCGETEPAFRLHLAQKRIKRIKTGKHLVFLRKDLDEYIMQNYGT